VWTLYFKLKRLKKEVHYEYITINDTSALIATDQQEVSTTVKRVRQEGCLA
jgi:hypothetical protein